MEEKRFGPLKLGKGDEGWVVVGCDTEVSTVRIPVAIDGEGVVAIGPNAFANCKKMREVIFPETEEYIDADVFGFEIGDYAFENCTSLLKISLPDITRCVWRGAFYGCSMLKRVGMPDCFVGAYVFYGCEKLVEVPKQRYISEGVFSHCKALADFPVKEGCRSIDEDAFYHCYGLVDVTIPSSVSTIEPMAFRSCYNLRRVTFESPEGWYVRSRYRGGEYELDLSDPEKNAKMLSGMDFDDGVSSWYKKQ